MGCACTGESEPRRRSLAGGATLQRDRVLGIIASVIAPLIAPVVGPSAPALGRVLADLGLRTLLQAEVGSSEPDEAANRAVATTVEEVVRHVALARCHAGG